MTTHYGDAGVLPRTNVYAEREMLKHAKPVRVFEKVTKPVRMPKNKTETIKFRRPVTFTAADTPLSEGVTPSATQFQFEDVSATLKQYGQVVEITDKISDLHEDPVLQEASTQCGENIGRTLEALAYGVAIGGTNVFYANGSQRTDVNTPISLAKQRAVTQALNRQKAMKITTMLSGDNKFATRPISGAYIGIAHTDMESDIRNLPGFTPVAEYGTMKPISDHEIGAVENVRYLLSPDLDPIADGGAATSTMVTTGGSNADIYPILYFGQDAMGEVALRGAGAISPSIIPVDSKTKDDPLGQRGYVGWKTWYVAVRLNELWMARLEVASTAL